MPWRTMAKVHPGRAEPRKPYLSDVSDEEWDLGDVPVTTMGV
jgi:hypothetical protein